MGAQPLSAALTPRWIRSYKSVLLFAGQLDGFR